MAGFESQFLCWKSCLVTGDIQFKLLSDITQSLKYGHPCRFLGFSHCIVSPSTHNAPRFQSSLSVLSIPLTPSDPSCFYTQPLLVYSRNLLPLPREIQAFPLKTSLVLSFFGLGTHERFNAGRRKELFKEEILPEKQVRARINDVEKVINRDNLKRFLSRN